MRLLLEAKSKLQRGYTPDWIRISFPDPNNPDEFAELVMDIEGSIDYVPTHLNVQVKGELVPWAYFTEDGEVDLSALSEEEQQPYFELFEKHLATSTDVVVGIYPCGDVDEDDEDKEYDTMSEGVGEYATNDIDVSFTFTCEHND
jgi:hypothetical protein